jgi:hypothetical protein
MDVSKVTLFKELLFDIQNDSPRVRRALSILMVLLEEAEREHRELTARIASLERLVESQSPINGI